VDRRRGSSEELSGLERQQLSARHVQRCDAQFNGGHLTASELVERRGLPGCALGTTQLRALPGTGNGVQHARQLRPIGLRPIGLRPIEDARKQRSGEVIAIDRDPFRHASQSSIAIIVQDDSERMDLSHESRC